MVVLPDTKTFLAPLIWQLWPFNFDCLTIADHQPLLLLH